MRERGAVCVCVCVIQGSVISMLALVANTFSNKEHTLAFMNSGNR